VAKDAKKEGENCVTFDLFVTYLVDCVLSAMGSLPVIIILFLFFIVLFGLIF
jgi:hypothetical protein